MKIYWSEKLIPELAELSKKERKRVWRKALFKVLFSWKILVAFLPFCLIIGIFEILYEISWRLVDNVIKVYRIEGIFFMIGLLIGCFVMDQVVYRLARPHIREILKDQNK